jgi:hypothetical protein
MYRLNMSEQNQGMCLSKYMKNCEKKIQVKEQLVVRKDMDVNEHGRPSNITLVHNCEDVHFSMYLCNVKI